MTMTHPEGLPPQAKPVYKGEVWEIWRWEQEMYDGSTGIYERAKRADSVTIIPVVGDRILVLHQEQPFRGKFISLPGGFQEEEEPLKAAQRELLEETGFASDDWDLYLVCSPGGSKMEWKNYFYVARNCRAMQEPTPDPGEKISLEWVSFDEFLALADNALWRHPDFIPTMLRARYEQKRYHELKEALFGE